MGRQHTVITGVALTHSEHGRTRSLRVESRVRMRSAQRSELVDYVATGEPLDKAGGYAVQGEGSRFVVGLEGSKTNVIGLPNGRDSGAPEHSGRGTRGADGLTGVSSPGRDRGPPCGCEGSYRGGRGAIGTGSRFGRAGGCHQAPTSLEGGGGRCAQRTPLPGRELCSGSARQAALARGAAGRGPGERSSLAHDRTRAKQQGKGRGRLGSI